MDVTANNWLLPCKGDEFIVSPIRAQGLAIRMGWERSPIFENLQQTHWNNYFGSLSNRELQALIRLYGLKPKAKSKAVMVLVLSEYFRKQVDA